MAVTPKQWRWAVGGFLRCDHRRRALPCKIATSCVISQFFCSILSLDDTGIEFRVELAPDRPYVAAFFMRSHLGSFCQFSGSATGTNVGGQGTGAERILREPCCGNDRGYGNNRVGRPGLGVDSAQIP